VAEGVQRNVAAASALNAFIVTTPEKALEAAAADRCDRAAGKPLGKMAGVPIGMKDLFATKGVQTTAASHILEGFVPEYESTVSQKLWDAGAGCWASSTSTSSRWARRTRPAISAMSFRRGGATMAAMPLAPGGSSGGSSAAIAGAARARRRPAPTPAARSASPPPSPAFRGIKPTYGRCSRWGIVAFASSLDQAGPMARDVRDCAIMLEAMAGFDPKDSTSLDLPVPEWEAGLNGDLKGKRSASRANTASTASTPTSRAKWDKGIAWLKDAGAEDRRYLAAAHQICAAAYYIIAPAEASSNLARYDGVRYGLRDLPDGAGLQDMYAATRAAGLRARGEAPHHDRHLCAVGRLLRRLLHAGAEGPHADCARFRQAFKLRRDPCADRAERPLRWAKRAPIRWRCT
jgi:aspartyl-tRNA(Asn)/glutamyl-tRNA(Gln) amidotransferase subunit A